jgi:hypothetical protein
VTQAQRQHLVGCGWFWAWAFVGAGAALSVVSTLGTLTALPVALVVLLMARKPRILESAFGLLSGAGLLLLYVAWRNRTAEWLDPHLWVILGAGLLVIGIVGHAVRDRR